MGRVLVCIFLFYSSLSEAADPAAQLPPAPKAVTPAVPAFPVEEFAPPASPATNASGTNLLQALQTYLANNLVEGSMGGDPPPGPETDWNTYTFPNDHKFSYGGVGAGNIGNGLCTASNSGRTQVSRGYCGMLQEVLNDPNSCAHRAMTDIINAAGPTGSGIGDLQLYCSNFQDLGSNKSLFFEQLLAGLITEESGWNPKAAEKPWTKNGMPMGGMGIFQIGVSDQSQDPDCGAINSESIFDAQTNIKCGACIALKNLDRDKTIGNGSGDSGARGLARYFGPFRNAQMNKRVSIQGAVSNYCSNSPGNGNGDQAPPTGTAN